MFITPIFTVRAHMVGGNTIDLLLFAEKYQAADYAAQIDPLPIGFDYVEVVELSVLGAVGAAAGLRAA